MFWRKNPTEHGHDREIERQAGMLLCTLAGVKHTFSTARYLAEVVREDRWMELNPETRRRLQVVGTELLQDLSSDVLD